MQMKDEQEKENPHQFTSDESHWNHIFCDWAPSRFSTPTPPYLRQSIGYR